VKVGIDKSFPRDVDRIDNKNVLKKLRVLISELEKAESIQDIKGLRKIEGYGSYCRIKIGEYRLGLEVRSGKEVALIRFLNRKDIYRFFPKKK
jgi:mRNA interferase RelE/StbE